MIFGDHFYALLNNNQQVTTVHISYHDVPYHSSIYDLPCTCSKHVVTASTASITLHKHIFDYVTKRIQLNGLPSSNEIMLHHETHVSTEHAQGSDATETISTTLDMSHLKDNAMSTG